MFDLKEDILKIMTPKELLLQSSFEKPFIISPKEFDCFETLLKYRDEIKNLLLVPVKDDDTYKKYHLVNEEDLKTEVELFLKDSPIALVKNAYPYWLSEDIEQKLIWIKENTEEDIVLSFIEKTLIESNLTTHEVILFERPLGIKVPLIKGTFPYKRHIHFWHKK